MLEGGIQIEERYYDDDSIAANSKREQPNSKREQLMKEAEEYRLRRHIMAMKDIKAAKALILKKQRQHGIAPQPSSTSGSSTLICIKHYRGKRPKSKKGG